MLQYYLDKDDSDYTETMTYTKKQYIQIYELYESAMNYVDDHLNDFRRTNNYINKISLNRYNRQIKNTIKQYDKLNNKKIMMMRDKKNHLYFINKIRHCKA